MQPGISSLIARIRDSQRSLGEPVERPASSDAIEDLNERARKALDVTLPPDYQEFLKTSDGFDYNGYVIYACRQAEQDGRTALGFVEANEILRDGPYPGQVAFGETGDDLFVQDRTSGRFAIVDRASASTHETFPDFNSLIERVLTLASDS